MQLPVYFPNSRPTALSQPQRVLQRGNEGYQNQGHELHSAQLVKSVAAGINRRIAQILLDSQQLVVFGQAVGA